MKEKRILFTGGGTAGHVIVNLALIPHFQQQGWKIDYIGSKNGIEKDLIKDMDGVTYHPISTGKLRRYLSLENMKDPFKVLKGTWDAWRIIGKSKPNVIFSKGGFVSVPVIVASKLRRKPAIIHESDLTPGLANKLSIPFAKKVLATFPETMKYLPKKKAENVGAVIREELFTGDRNCGLELIHSRGEKPVMLIMGGSIGSQKINQCIRENLEVLTKEYEIIHICGKNNVDDSIKHSGYHQFEYVNKELKDIFAITDVVISRAGSNAIFEFLALNIPMLLIPLSLAASRGDQIDNAASFKKQGFANVLREEELTNERFLNEVDELTKQKINIKEKMKEYESGKSRERVIEIIKEMAK